MLILLLTIICPLVSSHGTLTKPIARSLLQMGAKPGQGLELAGKCPATTCAWYTQMTHIPGNITNCDKKMRTMGVNCDSKTPPDWTCNKRVPWCAPGTAPVKSPCGIYGGGYNQNSEDMLNLPNIELKDREIWVSGGTAHVAHSVTANHGGGYTFRLCKADTDLSEACFQKNVLTYVSDYQTVIGMDGKPITKINASRTNKGTHPKGSVWTKNPIPQEEGLAPAPVPGAFGRGPFHINIMDEVNVPDGLPAGHYVLSWRWDAEAVPQVWQGCSDVQIVSNVQEPVIPESTSSKKQVCNGASVGLDVDECAIWQTMYDSLGGPGWADCSENRLDPCGCTQAHWGHFILCDSHRNYKHLKEIYLMKNNVTGTIPADVAKLSELGALDLNSNDIHGTIPKEIGYMKNLRALWLDHNPRLTGPVPSSFVNLNLEEAFELHWCNLTGTLPALPFNEWGDCVIMNNNFDCPLPPLGALWCGATCS